MSDVIPADEQEIYGNLVQREPDEASNVLTTINKIAARKDIDPDRLHKMMDLYDRLRSMKAQESFNRDFALMQADLPIITEKGEIKDKNGRVQSKYAYFEDIMDEVRPVLKRHGFSVNFSPDVRDGMQVVTANLRHVSGATDHATVQLPIDESQYRNKVQNIASSLSYAKRYALTMVLNLTSGDQRLDDDDGKRADRSVYINQERQQELQAILDQISDLTGENEAAHLCDALGVEALAFIPAKDWDKARNSARSKYSRVSREKGAS